MLWNRVKQKMVTQAQIQSMVDGECSHEVRATLLREIEFDPVHWRALALALLEEQEFSRQISSSAKRNLQSLTPTTIAASFQGLVSSEPVKPLVRVASLEQLGGAGEKSVKRSAPWGSALAASFLLGVGIYGGSFLPDTNSLKSNDATDVVAGVLNGEQRIGDELPIVGRLDSNMGMLVSGPNREREEIPIYDLNAIDHEVFVAREMYEVAKINQRLRKEGFELDVRPEYYTGKLNDGRQLIVPVKHVGLKPYGL